jgi:hypothetical protein
MPNLLVLISTLGGLVFFGLSGFIVGPILAALFVTVWEMFGAAFRDELRGREVRAIRTRGRIADRRTASPSLAARAPQDRR